VEVARRDVRYLHVLPDEFNWSWFFWRRKAWEASRTPEPNETDDERKAREAEMTEWKNQTFLCTCPTCRAMFKQRYGLEPPATLLKEFAPGSRSLQIGSYDKAARCWLKFRYDCTTEWVRGIVKRVREVNPTVKLTTCYALNPLVYCRRYEPSVAWDRIGYETDIDYAGSDPYIGHHNLFYNNTHYYVPEATLHMVGASPKTRTAHITLQCSQLDYDRPLEEVEVYGSAVSAVAHGARAIEYFSMIFLRETEGYFTDKGWSQEDARHTRNLVKTAFTMVEDIEPWVAGARKPRDIALIYSRASDDLYQLFNETDPPGFLIHRCHNIRYAYMAQKEVIRFLLREDYMFDLRYLEQLNSDEIRDYALVVVPFPFAIDKKKADVLTEAVRNGVNLLVISEFGMTDELGDLHKQSPMLDLLGLKETPRGETDTSLKMRQDSPFLGDAALDGPFSAYQDLTLAGDAKFLAVNPAGKGCGVVSNTVGKGQVIFLAGEFGIDLPERRRLKDVREEAQDKLALHVKCVLPRYEPSHYRVLAAAVNHLLGSRRSFTVKIMDLSGNDRAEFRDVEAVLLQKETGERVVLLINWEHWRNTPILDVRNLPDGTYQVTQRDLEGIKPFDKARFSADELHALRVPLKPGEVKALYLKKAE
jgi:hypothetical protein